MTHTPGPWRLGRSGTTVVCDTEIPQWKTGDPGSLEAYGGHLVGESMTLVNARLIAAAPELLEALETMVAGRIEWEASLDIARAAIAKARGTT